MANGPAQVFFFLSQRLAQLYVGVVRSNHDPVWLPVFIGSCSKTTNAALVTLIKRLSILRRAWPLVTVFICIGLASVIAMLLGLEADVGVVRYGVGTVFSWAFTEKISK